MKIFGIPARGRQFLLLAVDVVVILLAVVLGHFLRFGAEMQAPWRIFDGYTGASLFFVSATLLVLYVFDAYDPAHDFRRRFEILRLGTALFVGLLLQLVVYAVFPHGWWGRGVAATTAGSVFALMIGWRALFSALSPRTGFALRTAVLGSGRSGRLVAAVLGDYERTRLVGFIQHERRQNRRHDDRADEPGPEAAGPELPVLGDSRALRELVREHELDYVVVAVTGSLDARLTTTLLDLKASGLRIEDMPTSYKRLTGKVPIAAIADVSLIFGPEFTGVSGTARALQRLADVGVSLVGLLLAAPVIALAALVVRLESRGPAFFRQERLGINERPFQILKLRTMREGAEAGGPQWSEGASDPRVTRIGRFLRRTRIDELPQLFNVLRGDMSLIGPRPERAYFVEQLKEVVPYYGLRFAVKPGVTGWAQVKYGYGSTVEDAAEKLCYDLYAIQEMNPAMYLLILVKTLQTVLLRPGS